MTAGGYRETLCVSWCILECVMKNSDLCICILDETILAYHRHNEQGWLGLNIKGERAYHHQG